MLSNSRLCLFLYSLKIKIVSKIRIKIPIADKIEFFETTTFWFASKEIALPVIKLFVFYSELRLFISCSELRLLFPVP